MTYVMLIWLLWILQIIVIVICMLNFLIAIVSDSYAYVKDRESINNISR